MKRAIMLSLIFYNNDTLVLSKNFLIMNTFTFMSKCIMCIYIVVSKTQRNDDLTYTAKIACLRIINAMCMCNVQVKRAAVVNAYILRLSSNFKAKNLIEYLLNGVTIHI